MQNIYCLSGLGADEQIFKKLHVSNATLVHLPWEEHEESDDLPRYARRMRELIKEPNPVILGVSFGGMLAVEIAKQMPVKKAILVSSAKTKYEVTHFGPIVKAIVVSEIIPPFMYKLSNKYIFERFGATTEDELELMKGILRRSDGVFMRWAMKAIQLWTNTEIPPNIVHIHGTADQLIRPGPIKADYWIQGGSHIMIYNRADEMAAIIEKELYTQGRVGYKMP